MKILHIGVYPEQWLTYTKKSGVASYLKNLITSGSHEWYEFDMLCDKDGSPDRYIEDTVTVIRWWKVGISSIIDIIKYISHHHKEYDVIHLQHELHYRGSMIVGYLVLLLPIFFRSKNLKWIITSHHAIDYATINTEFVRNHGQKLPVWVIKLGFKVLYRFYRLRDKVIVHEQVHTTRLAQQYGLPEDKIAVIPHGVSSLAPIDQSSNKQQLGISQSTRIIFTMWYVTGYKDLAVLIRWYALWLKDNPDSILIIWAWPEKKSLNNPEYAAYYASLQDLAAQLIPADKYLRLWFVASEDIPLYYSACDVIVLPYRYTLSASGPMAIAIAYERPFLASRCFEDYFPDFSQCIFDMDEVLLAESLSDFYTCQWQFEQWVKELKQERLYNNCLQKTLLTYGIKWK